MEVIGEINSLYTYVRDGLGKKLQIHEIDDILVLMAYHSTVLPNLKIAFEYIKSIKDIERGRRKIDTIFPLLNKLLELKLYSLASAAYRSTGIIYRKHGDFKRAHELFDIALDIALANKLDTCIANTLNTIGFSYFHQKEWEKEEGTLSDLLLDHSTMYVTPFIYENLTLIADNKKDLTLALERILLALNISYSLDHAEALPGECLYLGENYERHFNDLDKAEYYLRMGYENCLRYADAGISLVGDRKRVLEAYVDFLKRRDPPSVGKRRTASSDAFAFAQGKSWKTIKETFHQQLIRFHAATSKTGRMLAAKLNMPATTLYSLQTRLKNQGYSLAAPDPHTSEPEHPLQNYIKEHETLSWDEVNAIFERELVHYLYEKYGYNKLRMSKILELSYAIIIEKTRDLTHYNENLLSN